MATHSDMNATQTYLCQVYKKPEQAPPEISEPLLESIKRQQDLGGFPLEIENAELVLRPGEMAIVVGPNGVGKSALLSEIARSLNSNHQGIVETFFGSRQIYFQSDEIDQVSRGLKTLEMQLNSNPSRYHHPYGEEHLKSVVKRAVNQESQVNSEIVAEAEAGDDFETVSSTKVRTIKSMNEIFASARFPVRFFQKDGGLKVKRGQDEYGVDRLSDGERAALLVACAVLVRPENSFIIIDEPERHLNPAISGPFLAALVRTRPDVGFVFSTHDLDLLEWLQPDTILHLRDSALIKEQPEQRRYDFSVIHDEDELPEELKLALLGTRKRLLLVEGTATSEDQALYSQIYPEWHIVATGNCGAVIDGTKSLTSHQTYHWLQVAGLIDGDGRNQDEIEKLAEKNVHTLPVSTIENVFLHPSLISAMAHAAHNLHGGDTAAERVDEVEKCLPDILDQAKDDIIARRVVWRASRTSERQMVSVKDVKSGSVNSIPEIDLSPIREEIEKEFAEARSMDNLIDALQSVPIKETAVPHIVAQKLGYEGFNQYKQAILKQLEEQNPIGVTIKSTLETLLPDINAD